jgi:hypothetical protein
MNPEFQSHWARLLSKPVALLQIDSQVQGRSPDLVPKQLILKLKTPEIFHRQSGTYADLSQGADDGNPTFIALVLLYPIPPDMDFVLCALGLD